MRIQALTEKIAINENWITGRTLFPFAVKVKKLLTRRRPPGARELTLPRTVTVQAKALDFRATFSLSSAHPQMLFVLRSNADRR